MFFRSLCGSLLAVLFATSGKAQFEIRGSRLYLDGSPFTVRGIAYSPTPVGQTPGDLLRLSGCVYWRDFPLMARAGINTVRIYSRIPSDERALWRALENSNLYLLAGFPLDPYYDPKATLAPGSDAGRALRAKILSDFRDYAAQLRDSRRVIALVFGNEVGRGYERKFAGNPRDFYTLLEEAAEMLAAAFGSSAPLVTTAVDDGADIGQAALGASNADVPGLSFWSVNVFRGAGFGGLFDELRRKTVKGVLVSEFGVDAWDSARQVEDSAAQTAALRSLASQLRQESARTGSTLLGGVWLGWTDEWWRGGPDPFRHGSAGEPRLGFPDGVANPAWFGLFGVSPTDLAGLDSLRPRPAFSALADEWGGTLPAIWPAPKPRLNPQGVVNAASLSAPVALGGLLSVFGEDLAEAEMAGAGPALPFQLGLTSFCLGSLPVPVLSVGAGQISGQAPWETAPGTVPALAYRAGSASNAVSVEVREVAPGILDRGVIAYGRPCPVTVANGVRPGTYLEIYGTGLGSASIALPAGVASAVARPTDVLPRAFLESRELRVLYSGLAAGFVGLYQINTQVPEDFPAGSPVRLRLAVGGAESNLYSFTVLSDADQPQFTLGPEALNFVVQAGGPPQSAELAIEGRNGFCELVRFAVAGLPDGVSASLPVGFPGQRVPVTVQAAPQARGQDAVAVVRGISLTNDSPAARLRITVLPSQGDIAFRIVSGGFRAGSLARFEMAGRLLHETRGGGPGRGFNFVTANGDTGVLGPVRNFDTWLGDKASDDMADYLGALPAGTVVFGAIADEGTLHLTARARAALRQVLRAQLVDALRYQDSWAIIGRVGAAAAMAEEAASDRQVILDRVLTFPAP